MSASKAALKAVGAAIKVQKYDEALEQVQKLLVSDPKNYQG
jgi:superkiller protein 3